MPYIARTDGGTSVLELRQGVLLDIPETERGNWRAVSEVYSSIEPLTQARSAPALTVNGDGSQVNLVVTAVDLPVALAKLNLASKLAETRWRRTQAGVTLPNGVVIATDDNSQSKIHQALSILEKGWVTTIDYRAKTGYVTVDLAAMTAISQAVSAYVQGCFTAERTIVDAIANGTVTTLAAIQEHAAWP